MCLVRAEFRVTEPAEVVAYFDEEPEYVREEDGAWSWMRPIFDESTDEEISRYPAGTIRLFGDSLLVEVLAEEYFEELESDLKEFLGAELVSVSRSPFGAGRPVDDRLDDDRRGPIAIEELPPETQEAMNRMMREHDRAWLDEEVPALGGLTPRQACRTETGRRRVAALIRSFPRLRGAAVGMSQAELFHELGLDEEAREREAAGEV
jgi:hypothetical protein